MKKQAVVLSGVVALMLLSFALPQEKKAVRLKNGNYMADKLKIENKDVEAIQQLAQDLSDRFNENDNKSEKELEVENGKTKYKDLMTILESKAGYKAYAASWFEDDFTFFQEEVHEDVISTVLYHEDDDTSLRTGSMARTQEKIDAIMNPYL